jgi:hypothetical protein
MARVRRTVSSRGQSDDNGIRAILLRNRVRELAPWRLPGDGPDTDAFEAALRRGDAVVVDSATLWIALEHAKLPNGQFASVGGRFGGPEHRWLVSEDGEVSPWTVEDSIEQGIEDQDSRYDPEPDVHCKGGRTCFRCQPGGPGSPVLPRSQLPR